MNEWWNLFKKEYRMARNLHLFSLVAVIIGGLWLFYKSQGYHLGILLAPASFMFFIAILTPPIYMLSNVSQELKQTPHLWLHCPQPAWMLLSTKLATAIILMFSFLLLTAAFVLLALFTQNIPHEVGITSEQLILLIFELGIYGIITILGISLNMAAWSTLMAVASAAARNVLGRFRVLVGIGVFILGTWGMDKVSETTVFQALTQWGAIPIRLQSLKDIIPQEVYNQGPEIFAGQIVAVIVMTIALYALSAWLIDNKVEV